MYNFIEFYNLKKNTENIASISSVVIFLHYPRGTSRVDFPDDLEYIALVFPPAFKV